MPLTQLPQLAKSKLIDTLVDILFFIIGIEIANFSAFLFFKPPLTKILLFLTIH